MLLAIFWITSDCFSPPHQLTLQLQTYICCRLVGFSPVIDVLCVLQTASHFLVLRRFAVVIGKFYLLGSSGGQSGWLEGWAARNAGLLSSSRSIRNIMGYGRKSTWNLRGNQWCHKYTWNNAEIYDLPSGIEHLRHEAAVGHWDLVTNAVFASRSGQGLLHGTEATCYPVLCPLLLLFLADVDEYNEVLKRLNARANDLNYLANLGPLVYILWQQRTLGTGLLQVVHNGHRFDQRMPI